MKELKLEVMGLGLTTPVATLFEGLRYEYGAKQPG
jgi:hypothetical protein